MMLAGNILMTIKTFTIVIINDLLNIANQNKVKPQYMLTIKL